MTYGPRIALTAGKFPDWLAPDDIVAVIDRNGVTWPGMVVSAFKPFPESINSFLLDADHWAYQVIEKGYEPWSGGDAAPTDYDKTQPVLLRDGYPYDSNVYTWSHDNVKMNFKSQVIGYKRKTIAPIARVGSDDYGIACRLYYVLHTKHYPEAEHFKPAPDVEGVLMQIDHITAKLESVDGVHVPTLKRIIEAADERVAKMGLPMQQRVAWNEAIQIVRDMLPPVDPDLITAREITASLVGTDMRESYISGQRDHQTNVQAALAGLKHAKKA